MTSRLVRAALCALLTALITFPLFAAGADALSLSGWPQNPRSMSEVGRGAAVVFSPDLTVQGNRAFYESLGFVYLEGPDWADILEKIRQHNRGSLNRIRVVVLETHGTNGNGLKLQDGHEPRDQRSYVAVGALQQALTEACVSVCLISACNAGRLFRPGIFSRLDRDVEDPLFLPATCGIVESVATEPALAPKTVMVRRSDSNLETLMEGSLNELDPDVRASFSRATGDGFVISTMLIELLLRDPALQLASSGWVEEKSRADLSSREIESLFRRFVRYVARTSTLSPGLKTAANTE